MKTGKRILAIMLAFMPVSSMLGQGMVLNEEIDLGNVNFYVNPHIDYTYHVSLSSAQGGAHYGAAVAVSGDGKVVFIGSPEHSNGDGKVHMYRQQADFSWNLAKIFHGPAERTEKFGSSVACSNDGKTLVVGATGANSERGSIYVYKRSGKSWLESKYAAPGKDLYFLGASLAISGDGNVIAVGAPSDDYDSGSVRVFRLVNGIYQYDGKLSPTGMIGPGTINQKFGTSVAISETGDSILAGSPYSDGNKTNSGAAFLFNYSNSLKSWNLFDKLVAPDGANNDLFGTSVAVSGQFIVVGAPKNDHKSLNGGVGAAYIYEWGAAPNAWGMTKKLMNSQSFSSFGYSVSMYHDQATNTGRLIVGDNDFDFDYNQNGVLDNRDDNAGAVFMYHFNDVTYWDQFDFFTSHMAGGTEYDDFGKAVAVSRNGLTYVVGAPEEFKAIENAFILQ